VLVMCPRNIKTWEPLDPRLSFLVINPMMGIRKIYKKGG
jgi:hypothetical protein